jgi:hypothetical protein
MNMLSRKKYILGMGQRSSYATVLGSAEAEGTERRRN